MTRCPPVLTMMTFLVLVGCGDAVPSICDRPSSAEPTLYTQGQIVDGVYMTAGWHGENDLGSDGGLLHYPGGKEYLIQHDLGCEPLWWVVYLSFERDGLTSGSIASAAGNQAQLQGLDETTITILNASCVEYWMMLRASCASP